jgi:hypothetical protein
VLTVRAATTINQQPTSQAVSPGSNAVFQVSASGEGLLTYQWQKNGNDLTNGGHCSGVSTATLAVTGVDGNDVGSYACVVDGGCGSVSSASVGLSLLTAGVFSADYAVNRAVADGGFIGISDTRTVNTGIHSVTNLTQIFHKGLERNGGGRVRRLDSIEPHENTPRRHSEDRL